MTEAQPTAVPPVSAHGSLRLLHVVSSVDLRHGGVAEALLQSGLACMAEGHQVEVLTLDDDRAPHLTGYPLTVHTVGRAWGGFRYAPGLIPWLQREARRFDAVIVHGLWQYHTYAVWSALRSLPVPYYVYPHGMLDPWFKRAHPAKHMKKWLVWPWSDYRLLRDATAVLFTCDEERRLARDSFWLYRARETVVAFGTRRPPDDGPRLRAKFLEAHPSLRGQRILLFLGRLHPKKGCDLLVRALADAVRVAPALRLVMAGPDADHWRPALEAMATSAGVADCIVWPGMLQGDLKWGAFHAAEAFVLPSHQENFGIAVAEALACGCPVLISNKVNIWREIDRAGAGLVGDDTLEGTRDLLLRWLATGEEARRSMSRRARACFEHHFTIDAMAGSLVERIRTDLTAEQGAVA